MSQNRVRFDPVAYAERVAAGCFVCRMLADEPGFEHEAVWSDEEHVVFLNRYPTTPGQLLVAPRRHVEQLAGHLDEEAWVRMQRVVHRAAVALEAVVPTERVYVASLGSQQGNAHLHVHVAALPPGTPPGLQQLAALDAERVGVVDLPADRAASIATQLRNGMAATSRPAGHEDAVATGASNGLAGASPAA